MRLALVLAAALAFFGPVYWAVTVIIGRLASLLGS